MGFIPEQPWLVCDIDGTLSDFAHRLHFIKEGEKPNWRKFNGACTYDTVIPATLSLLNWAKSAGVKIILSTGRSQRYETQTLWWLKTQNVPYDLLLMRPDDDNRSSAEIKKNHYQVNMTKKNIIMVLEDRDKEVEMWRELGLTCLQVQKGAY
jgi:hypothetical protein